MRINAPGMPQQHGSQPEIHTFIGDTPQVPDKVDLEIEETSFSAVRAYRHSSNRSQQHGTESSNDDDFDIRKASPREQAQWLAADDSLTY